MVISKAGVVAWGADTNHQLGLNRPLHVVDPVVIGAAGALAGKQVIQVSDGYSHTLALTADGQVYAWGANYYGELGTGNTRPENQPVDMPLTALGSEVVVAVAAGNNFSLALTQSGLIYGWGRSDFGQLGVITKSVLTPILISGGALAGRTVKKVVTGSFHSLALTNDGLVITWGSNNYGQVGNGSTQTSAIPYLVSDAPAMAGLVITEIAAGSFHSLAVAEDGRAFSWGYSLLGPLGRTGNALLPGSVDMTGVLAGKKVRKIVAGYYHTLALADDGKLYAWGDNSTNAYLGDLSFTDSYSNLPRAVRMQEIGDRKITQIMAGANHSTVLADDGTLYSWGFNSGGPFGDGSKTSQKILMEVVPRAARVGRTITTLCSSSLGGSVHVITSDGTLLGWGWDHNGQVGAGGNGWRTEPADLMLAYGDGPLARLVAASDNSSVLITSGNDFGSSPYLYQFGRYMETNGFYTTKPRPFGIVPILSIAGMQVAAGREHALRLMGDGKLYAWGNNKDGQGGSGLPYSSLDPVNEVSMAGVLAGKSFFSNRCGCGSLTGSDHGWWSLCLGEK